MAVITLKNGDPNQPSLRRNNILVFLHSFTVASAMKLLLPIFIAFPAIALASGPYTTTVVPWKPKNATSVDVSTVYYLSDRTNGIVHIVDLSSATETGSISGFVGAHIVNGTLDKPTSGPTGLLGIPGHNELFVGDGDGTVKVVDLSSNKVVDKVQLETKKRADEMTFDAKHNLAVVTGPDDDIASIWFISVTDRKIVWQHDVPQCHERSREASMESSALINIEY